MPIPDPDIHKGDDFYAELFRGTGSVLEDPMMRDACRAFAIGNSPHRAPPGLAPEVEQAMGNDIFAMQSALQSAFRAKWKDRLTQSDPYSAEARAIPPNAAQAAASLPPIPDQQEPMSMPNADPHVAIRVELRAKGYSDQEIDDAIAYQNNMRVAPRAQAAEPRPQISQRRADDPEIERRLIAKGFTQELIAQAMALPVTIIRDLGEGSSE